MIYLILFLNSLITLSSADYNTQYNASAITSGSTYKNTYTFPNPAFKMQWNLENQGQSTEQLRILLTFTKTDMVNAWAGIGFGAGMRDSQFIVMHQRPNNAVQVHEHDPTLKEYAPPLNIEGAFIINVLSAGVVGNTLFAEVTRPTRPDDQLRAQLVSDGQDGQKMIWGLNPRPVLNYKNIWFSYHELNGLTPESKTHGAFTAFFAQGVVLPRAVVANWDLLRTHGFGMASMYLLFIPLGVYWARFFKSRNIWFVTHVTIQITASAGVAIFFVIILTTYQQWNVDHALVGCVLILLTTIQICFGGFTRLGMVREDVESYKVLKYLHIFNGFCIMLLSIVQVGLGLWILYPYYENRGNTRAVWIAYAIVSLGWIAVFAVTEVYYRMKVHVVSSKYERVSDGKNSSRIPSSRLDDLKRFQSSSDQEKITTFTWKQIDEDVRDGRILVVSNGKYVMDASKWINSHPGGKVILNSVAGTDISLDYFYESGFDALQFIPAKQAPSLKERGALPKYTSDPPAFDNSAWNGADNRFTNQENFQNMISLTDQEWNMVVKSRRTHVHSKLALERLSIGEIDNSNQSVDPEASMFFSDSLGYSNLEYRRYGMICKTLLTVDGESQSEVYKYKFALLYPYDIRQGQPAAFQVGDAIEIQMRLGDGDIESRFYTPISGDLTCFETIIKVKAGGAISTLLASQKPGIKQYKIRGSFPSSIVQKTSCGYQLPDHLVYIVGGSGITTFLQLLSTTILPVNTPLVVFLDYSPQQSDEIEVRNGHYVSVLTHSYDGWAHGVNLSTGAIGVFPLSVATPSCGPANFKITLINCVQSSNDIVGLDLLDGAMITYPNQITVHHICRDLSRVRDGVSGFVREGRLDDNILGEILAGVRSDGHRLAVLSGPVSFNNLVYDSLNSVLGWDPSEIIVCGDMLSI